MTLRARMREEALRMKQPVERNALATAVAIMVVLAAYPAWAQAPNEQLGSYGILILVAAAGPALAGLFLFLLQRFGPKILPRLLIALPPIRKRWATHTRVFVEAQIATILVPLVNEVFNRGQAKSGEVLIVGSDGTYLTSEKKRKLHDAILDWTSRGMTVRYLLVQPDEEVLKELDGLRQKLSSGGSLEILPLRALPNGAEDDLRPLVTVLQTLHPTLVQFTDNKEIEKRAMWIESEHLRGKLHSSGNRWVPPEAMGDEAGPSETWDDVFSCWRERLATLCAHVRSRQRRRINLEAVLASR